MTKTFEENLDQLEEIVQTLEQGTVSLDESLKAFEKGIKLSRSCQNELTKAEKKVEILISENGDIKKESFEE